MGSLTPCPLPPSFCRPPTLCLHWSSNLETRHPPLEEPPMLKQINTPERPTPRRYSNKCPRKECGGRRKATLGLLCWVPASRHPWAGGIFANIGLVVLCKARHVTHQNGEGLHGLRGSVSHLRGGLAAGAQGKGGRDSGQGSVKGEDLQSLGGVLPELLLTQPSSWGWSARCH